MVSTELWSELDSFFWDAVYASKIKWQLNGFEPWSFGYNSFSFLLQSGLRNGVRADDRSYCFSQFKTLPLVTLLQLIYPDLYRVDTLTDENALREEDENGSEILIPQPDRLQLSFERISAVGKWSHFFVLHDVVRSYKFTVQQIEISLAFLPPVSKDQDF